VNAEELTAAIILEEDESDGLMVCCVSEGVTDVFKKRKG
jgi:hypothetical protein